MRKLSCAKAPCKTCPYRKDVPSGLWAKDEYEKLKAYDGEMIDQLTNGGGGLFLCHQRDGNLCAGWVATHKPHNLLALRLHANEVDPAVANYNTSVPVFETGTDAAKHGMRDIRRPKKAARAAIGRLLRKADRDGGWS